MHAQSGDWIGKSRHYLLYKNKADPRILHLGFSLIQRRAKTKEHKK